MTLIVALTTVLRTGVLHVVIIICFLVKTIINVVTVKQPIINGFQYLTELNGLVKSTKRSITRLILDTGKRTSGLKHQ